MTRTNGTSHSLEFFLLAIGLRTNHEFTIHISNLCIYGSRCFPPDHLAKGRFRTYGHSSGEITEFRYASYNLAYNSLILQIDTPLLLYQTPRYFYPRGKTAGKDVEALKDEVQRMAASSTCVEPNCTSCSEDKHAKNITNCYGSIIKYQRRTGFMNSSAYEIQGTATA